MKSLIDTAFWPFVLALPCLGCSYAGEDVGDARKAAHAAYEKAAAAFEAKDYATAESGYAEALNHGGLNADLYEDTLVKLAVSKAATGKATEALADLDKMEAGSSIPDKISAARSYVLAKQGKAAEARAALAKARQYNRAVQEFKD